MKVAKDRSKPLRLKKRFNGGILAEAHVNRLSVVLEQIEGMNELLYERLQTEFENDSGAMAAYNVLREKAREAGEIVTKSFGELSAERIQVVVKNAPDPFSDAANPSFPNR